MKKTQLIIFLLSTILLISISAFFDLLLPLFLFIGAIFILVFVYYYPLVLVAFYVFIIIIPNIINQFANFILPTFSNVLRVSDLVVLLMLFGIIIKLFSLIFKNKRKISLLEILIMLFSFWLFYEIMRNMSVYGLSAPGEFRYRYMILIVPVYISVFFKEQINQNRLFIILIFYSLISPLVFLPIIGSNSGWDVGPTNRFFSASLSLGLLYGLLSIFLGKKYKLVNINSILLWLLSIPIVALILVDSHRSVWVASFITLLMLILLKEIDLGLMVRYIPALFFLILIVISIASLAGLDVIDYVATRGSEIFKPQATEGTAAWRLEQWRIAMHSFQRSPIQGIGFGGYWETGFSPHSLYVQTLVKLGLVGMFLYAGIVITLFVKMYLWLKYHCNKTLHEQAIVTTSLIILLAGHAFYSVYAFEEYTLLFVGLGMSVVNWNKSY